jgi:integrase
VLIGFQYLSGDIFAMSSRALTSDQIRQMYDYNMAEGRSTVQNLTSRVKGKVIWGSPRHRLLVHAVTTLAFNCLLRLDEVLNLRFEDIELRDDSAVVTLSSRKTHQFGGLLL